MGQCAPQAMVPLSPIVSLLLLQVVPSSPGAAGGAPPRPREVVVLYSDRGPNIDTILRDRLSAAPGGVHLVTENLDLSRLDDKDYKERLAGILRRKYSDRHVDLVIPVYFAAIRFMAEQGAAAFPGTPAAFAAADADRLKSITLPPSMAGVSGHIMGLPTVEAALALQPDTRRVVLVAGESAQDRYWRNRFLEELRVLHGRVAVDAPSGLTMPDLLDRLRALPDRTIVLFLTYTEDAAGSLYSGDAVRLISDASSVPVYSSGGQSIGFGVVGGYMFDHEREAAKASAIALRIFHGERPEDIGVRDGGGLGFTFDWRQLRRWNLPESRLPAGSEIRFRLPSPWDLYRREILAGLALMAFLAALVVGLLVQARRRQRAEQELDERLRFETLLSDLTRTLARSPTATLDAEIDKGLRSLSEALAVDRCELSELVEGSADSHLTHVYLADASLKEPHPTFSAARFPWVYARLRQGQLVQFSRLADLPEEAAVDRASMEEFGTRAKVFIPLTTAGAPLGILCLGMLRDHNWPSALLRRLELSAEVFGSVLMRRRFERLLDESRGLGSSLFRSLQGQAAILDRSGTIVAVNEAWAHAGPAHEESDAPVRIGDSYLEAFRTAAGEGPLDAETVRQRLAAVAERAAPGFSAEYRTRAAGGERWLELLVEPLHRSEGGAVVTLLDITDRKRAELEAARLRDDLAHLTRVSTLGELAASLAHELNQPLSAILSNVQAARILMSRPSPDLAEVREILSEVASDDKRAGEVIRRLGSLFKKGTRERIALDVNELIHEVLRLLHNDILLRGASLRTDLGTGLPPVEGDRIQLQQVVLNLALNGLDAMRDQPPGARHLIIRTSADATTMRIEVADTGPGIDDASRERLFEPFYTTKPTGMGMGLAISRSIVEAHGGSLSLALHRGRGAVFQVTFPTLVASAASV